MTPALALACCMAMACRMDAPVNADSAATATRNRSGAEKRGSPPRSASGATHSSAMVWRSQTNMTGDNSSLANLKNTGVPAKRRFKTKSTASPIIAPTA